MHLVLLPYELKKAELRRLYYAFYFPPFLWLIIPMTLLGLFFILSQLLIPGILIMMYAPAGLVFSVEWSLYRTKIVDKTITIEADDEFLYTKLSSGSESKSKYSDFFRIRGLKEYVLVFVNRASFIMIPDRAFRSYEDKEELWNRIAAHVPARHKPNFAAVKLPADSL